jgi:O-antigen ligase
LKKHNIIYYILAIAIGFGIGLKVIPDAIVLLGYFAILVFALISYLNNRPVRFIALFILASYLEPYSRTYLLSAPYLSLQYFVIFIALYTLLFKSGNTKYQYVGLIYFGLFFLLELLNSTRLIELRYTTGILTQTAAMLSFLYLGSKLSFERWETEYFLEVIFTSALLLSAIISVVYIKGDIQWTDASNFETSGGMGPVQISFYLAIGAFAGLYGAFISKGIPRLIYFFLSAVIILVMILTFSRGGLYMIGLMVVVSFFLQKKKKYIFLVIPLSIIMYWGIGFVADVTEGKIIDRYTQDGASSRDLLVVYGWDMFKENPITGIGTANYYFEVKKRKYLGFMSGAHNEIIRSFAEHGFMGGMLWLLFFIGSIFQLNRRRGFYRQIAMVLFTVFLASTFHNGLKLALQPMILLIAVASRPAAKFYVNNSNRKENAVNGIVA